MDIYRREARLSLVVEKCKYFHILAYEKLLLYMKILLKNNFKTFQFHVEKYQTGE